MVRVRRKVPMVRGIRSCNTSLLEANGTMIGIVHQSTPNASGRVDCCAGKMIQTPRSPSAGLQLIA
jgi:hypothetical protein